VGGTVDTPIYIMEIDGVAEEGIDVLEVVLDRLAREKNVETRLVPIDTLMG
jgi:hypothetical protein